VLVQEIRGATHHPCLNILRSTIESQRYEGARFTKNQVAKVGERLILNIHVFHLDDDVSGFYLQRNAMEKQRKETFELSCISWQARTQDSTRVRMRTIIPFRCAMRIHFAPPPSPQSVLVRINERQLFDTSRLHRVVLCRGSGGERCTEDSNLRRVILRRHEEQTDTSTSCTRAKNISEQHARNPVTVKNTTATR
jgi:hypothetical protein